MNYLESIFNNIDEGLIILTPEGNILFFNQEANHLHSRCGWRALVLAESLFQILPPDAVKKVQAVFAEVINKNEPYQLVADHKGVDGSVIYTETTYIPAMEDGVLTHINMLTRDVTVTKIFEKRMVGMANDLRNLIDRANAVIIATDSQGYITDWNSHDHLLTGHSKSDVLTQRMANLLLSDQDKPAFEDLLQRVLKGKPVVNVEVPILSKKGNRLIFLLNATARTNSSGQVIGAVFIGQDITDRRKMEQDSKVAHERLLFHIENAPLGFIEWDNELKVKSWTRQAEEIFGWNEQEVIDHGRTGYSQVYKDDLPWVSKIADDLLNGRIDRNHLQNRNIRKDGTVIWCEWFNSVLKDKEGKVITLMSLVQDITDRKKNELRLEEAQAMAHLGNWEMDLRSQLVKWSAEIYRILGYAPHDTQPSLQAYLNVVHPDDQANVKSIIGFSTKAFSPQSFYHRICRQQEERTLFIVAQYEFDAAQKPVRLYGTMMDVTEITEKERKLKLAVEELEAYKRTLEDKVEMRTRELKRALAKEKEVVDMKSRFVSIASHEFRTPLSSIQYVTNFVRKSKPWAMDKKLGEKMESIEKQVKNMMFLLDDVLAYGKSEASKIQLMISQIKLSEFLAKIVEDVEHVTKNTHRVQIDFQLHATQMATDEKLLRNVLINLLTNAIKYSPGKKKIYLHVVMEDANIRFTIMDDGMGIPPEDQDKVFEAFYRSKSVESIQGTGLGLSIVKKAVELLGGKIQLESKVGKGTSVLVTIPLRHENP